jgi:hypothetical protein
MNGENQTPDKPSDNLPQAQPQSQGPELEEIGLPPPPQRSGFQSRSFLTWGILLAVAIVLFFAGYGLGGLSKRNQVKTLQDQIEKLEDEKKKLNNTISEQEQTIADLDLGIVLIPYQNYEYAYQFSYTSDLSVIDYSAARNNIIALEKDSKTNVVIKVSREERPFDEYLGKGASETIKIDGQEATKHDFPDGIVREGKKSDPFTAYKVINNRNQYILEFYGSTSVSDNQKRILDSFEFVQIEYKI